MIAIGRRGSRSFVRAPPSSSSTPLPPPPPPRAGARARARAQWQRLRANFARLCDAFPPDMCRCRENALEFKSMGLRCVTGRAVGNNGVWALGPKCTSPRIVGDCKLVQRVCLPSKWGGAPRGRRATARGRAQNLGAREITGGGGAAATVWCLLGWARAAARRKLSGPSVIDEFALSEIEGSVCTRGTRQCTAAP